MGSILRVAFATLAIVFLSRFESVFAQSQRIPTQMSPRAESGASPDVGKIPVISPEDVARQAVCSELLRKLDVHASLMISYFRVHMQVISELLAAERKLKEELQRPFILYNKDEVVRLRLQIAKLKQQSANHNKQGEALRDELRNLEDEFFSINRCGDFYGDEKMWREKRAPNMAWFWDPVR